MKALAQVALSLLAEEEGVPLVQPTDTGPPFWSRPPRGSKRPARQPQANAPRGAQDEPEVRLFIPLGRAKGVRPSDLVGLLANEAGLPGAAIGRIEVLAHKSFVSMPQSLARHVLEVLPRAGLRGIDVPIALERNGAEHSKHQPRPHKPRPRKPRRHPAETRRGRAKPKKGKGLHKPHKRRQK